jgi:hypothetical protein
MLCFSFFMPAFKRAHRRRVNRADLFERSSSCFTSKKIYQHKSLYCFKGIVKIEVYIVMKHGNGELYS